jgi:MFS family permease
MILGSVLARRVASALKLGPTLVVSVLVCGLSYLILPIVGVGHALAALIICQITFGVADSIYGIHTMSLVQSITPANMMGRVGGTALSVVWGSGTFGFMLGGVLGTVVGVRPGIVAGALVIAAGAVFVILSPVRVMASYPEPARPDAESEALAREDVG